MKIPTLLVGLGKIGATYDSSSDDPNLVLSHANAIQYSDKFVLLGGVDSSSVKRLEFQNKYSVPVFESIERYELLSPPKLIVIATNTTQHLQALKAALSLKPTAILLEKPLASELADSQEILRISKESGIKIFCNYQRHSHKEFIDMAALIKNGLIKGPFDVTGKFSGTLLNSGSHMINLLLMLFSEKEFGKLIRDDISLTSHHFAGKGLNITLFQLLNLPYFIFEFEILAANLMIRYESHLDQITYSPLGSNAFYPNEITLLKPNKTVVLKEYQLLSKVYEEIAHFFDNEKYQLCELDDAFRTLELSI